MSHRLRQGLTVAGLLVLLIVAGSKILLPALPRQRVDIQLDAASAAAVPGSAEPEAMAAVAPAGASVQLYDISVLDLRRAERPPATALKPAARKPPIGSPAKQPTRPESNAQTETKRSPPKAEPQPDPPRPPAEPPKAAPSAPSRRGELPGLMVEFSALGLERYARLTERLGGAFFAYMGSEAANPLGPRISLAARRVLALGETSDLASDRPYLVSDPDVAERLRGIELPPGASQASVVMMWPRWLDRAVWSTVAVALSDSGARSEDVARIEASAREADGAVEVRIEGLVLRENGRRIALSTPRTVRVGS